MIKRKYLTDSKVALGTLAAAMLFCTTSSVYAQKAVASTQNVIGFFQTYDNPGTPTWYFNNGEEIQNSGYTILIDAFWVNYPYCWGDGSGQPGQGSPIPECKGIKNAPGSGTSNSVDTDFWNNYAGGPAPSAAGTAYNTYWTSLHASGPQTASRLRAKINASGKKIKLLASIGGWNMGGSSAGKPFTPAAPMKPAWAALLKSPQGFAKAMSDIVHLTVNGAQLYDGIDLDIETLYGEGCSASGCTRSDEQKAIDDMASAISHFKKSNPTAVLSISPRASDLVCEQQYCSWNNTNGVGFVGEILQKLAAQKIYFDEINPQFYNDDPERNIPKSVQGSQIEYGNQVVGMLKKIHDLGIVGANTSFNIGVLAQTNRGEVDAGGASTSGNPGVSKASIKTLWNLLQTDPQINATGIKINGIMGWAANLALANTGVGGNVRSTDSRVTHVVPYDWASDI